MAKDTSKGGKGGKGAPAKGGKGGKAGKGAPGKGGAQKGGPVAKGGKTAKAGGKSERQSMAPKSHAGAGLPVPAPRLKLYYEQTVRGRLAEQFGLTNPHQVPGLEKI